MAFNSRWPSARATFADWWAILALAIPITIASGADLLLSIVDTALAGHLGLISLAAIASGSAVYAVASQGTAASVIGYQILAQRRFGAGETALVGRGLVSGLAATLALSTVLAALIVAAAPLLIGFLTTDSLVAVQAQGYLQFRALGLVPWAALLAVRYTFDADRKAGVGMRVAIAMNLANVLFSYVLMFGWGPIPRLEAVGAGIGSLLADTLGLLLILYLAKRSKLTTRIRPATWRPDVRDVRSIARLSTPEVVSSVLDYSGNVVFFALLGGLGVVALGGGRIAFTVMLVAFITFFSLGVAIQILAGRALGAGDGSRARSLVRNGLGLACAAGGAVGLVGLLMPHLIVAVFTNVPTVAAGAEPAVQVMGLAAPVIAITTVAIGGLRAQGRTKSVMVTNVVTVWLVQLPVAWIGAMTLHDPVAGVFLGLLAYFCVRASWSLWLLKAPSFDQSAGRSL